MSEQEAAFPKVWESFCALDHVIDGRHDTPEWRSHDAVFAICLIRLPSSALTAELEDCRAALQHLAGVRVHPEHFLHIPLQELGFVTAKPRHPDEITPAALEEFVSLAASPVSERAPFTTRLGGDNSFKDAPFLEIHDDEESSWLHQRLFEIAAIRKPPRFPYLPHATIAHYTEAVPVGPIVEALAPWRGSTFGEFEVTEVEIATIATGEAYPPLHPFAIFPLEG